METYSNGILHSASIFKHGGHSSTANYKDGYSHAKDGKKNGLAASGGSKLHQSTIHEAEKDKDALFLPSVKNTGSKQEIRKANVPKTSTNKRTSYQRKVNEFLD